MAEKVAHIAGENPGEHVQHFLEDGRLHVLSQTDHKEGDKLRREIRDHDTYNNMDFANEAFTFTEQEYAIITKQIPSLVNGTKQQQRLAWVAFGNSSQGRKFRVK